MKRDILSTLILAAEQGPETPQLVKALRLARKEQARKSPGLFGPGSRSRRRRKSRISSAVNFTRAGMHR